MNTITTTRLLGQEAILAITLFVANAATIIDTTTPASYSIEDRGNFSLINTGQTFTTGTLGADNILSTIQLQQPRDYVGNSSGDSITLEL